jgi:hypothetical protein
MWGEIMWKDQHLHEQIHKGVQMPQPKLVDHREVGMLIAGKHPKRNEPIGLGHIPLPGSS